MDSGNTGNLASQTAVYPNLEEKVYAFPYPAQHGTARVGQAPTSRKRFFFGKRILDVALSSVALVALSPLLLLVAIWIKLDSKGPVFFRQVRVGRHGQPFVMYKFRSMCQNAEAMLDDLMEHNERDGPVFKISRDPRVTRVGALLRKTCLDELPQLFNILKGDMSIVGPRPPLPSEVEQYSPYHMLRLSVTPGLTCFWQVSNRNMAFDEWVDLDLQYIRQRCFRLDFRLIAMTFAVIFHVSGDR